ncbi:MAG: nucleotidyl transferase AbiEii/AbiGii toxin family protein [Hydrogenophaga sp.]|nr:nucleotidyl transferase AbiEii/AbiGii toxin family protein [Hydrogenophaga sp.]
MSTIYSPLDVGFDRRMHVIDRCQVALLRAVSNEAGDRLLVKGGMAMRVAFGSMRLTKDIHFDRVDSMSSASVKSTVRSAMKTAASTAGLRSVEIAVTKDTGTTTRLRMTGLTHTGEDVRFETEISGRDQPLGAVRQLVQVVPPSSYAIAPFMVHTYTLDAITVQKVAAVLADMRNVPRDIYDLKDLIALGANPVGLLRSLPQAKLDGLKKDILAKLSQITWPMADTHFLPYIPKNERDVVTTSAWDAYILTVSEAIDGWLSQASAPHGAFAHSASAPPDAAPRSKRPGEPT